MHEEMIFAIQNYIDKYLFEPCSNWPKHEFDIQSYSRWAAFELIQRIMDNPFNDPDIVIESFLLEMAMFSHLEEESKGSCIFSIAKDAAADILQLIS